MIGARLIAHAFSGAGLIAALALLRSNPLTAAAALQTPEQFIGFQVGADNKLARWDTVVDYMKLVASESDRVRFRELGTTSGGYPFVLLEIASPETLKSLDRFKEFEHQLYFRDGAPSVRERDEIFRRGKVVVVVTCSVHGSEVGATQMSLELVHRLATEESPLVRKILDNVILLLVPGANPDGQVLVTDWFNKNLGTPYEASPLPYLDHPYTGHDINRDMYMLTQKESQFIARLVWHDWIPSIWLDEHQMGTSGARIFVMPAGDPINPNVHPLIYRWNGILGQSQAAALEASGKEGIISGGLYSNFWQGAMAWSGWWHNQVGLLTEVAGVRIAAPVMQQSVASPPEPRAGNDDVVTGAGILPAPTDVTPRTEYPRPWRGGRWTLRDIVDYELVATTALLETAADRREVILRQIYDINRQTVEDGKRDGIATIVIPAGSQHDPREAAHLVDRLDMAGVDVYRAEAPFELDGRGYAAGSFVIPMAQVFARYAKDLLEKQTYPGADRMPPGNAANQPYDVTAWSLGMLLGVNVDFAGKAIPPSVRIARVRGLPKTGGRVTGRGTTFEFPYNGPDTAIAVNRLLKSGARVAFDGPSRLEVSDIGPDSMETIARDLALDVTATVPAPSGNDQPLVAIRSPQVAVYSPWTGGAIDEGWTRWVLEQYEFNVETVHNADLRAGNLRRKFNVLILPDQPPADILDGYNMSSIRPEYRGGVGSEGMEAIKQFIADGGTLIALGAATDLMIDRLQLPVSNLKRGLRREQHFAAGTILRVQVDTSELMTSGVAPTTYGYYDNGPFFAPTAAASGSGMKTTIVARYPNQNVLASGWLRGEEMMAGRAAVVSVEMNGGRVVLFGLRPQYRAQTHATFPMLFNALYLSTVAREP